MMKNEIILYRPDELSEHIEVRIDEETVWLNRQQISSLFNRDVKTISKHINNVFFEGELDKDATVANFATVQKEGDRMVERLVEYFNLDVIISVGYRVKSKQGTQFRIWANKILKDYLLKGYAINNRMNRIEDNVQALSLLLLTKTISKQLILDVQKVNEQYGNFELKPFSKSHDRFLIIDDNEIYHLGASLKDLGKRWFAFSKLDRRTVGDILKNINDLL